MRALRKAFRGTSRQAIWSAVRLNAFGIGLAALWTTLNTLILPDRVSDLVSSGREGTGLGVISFVGIGAAALFQPIAGFISDRTSGNDRRRPYIVGGATAVLAGLTLFGLAGQFGLLLIAYVLMQLASNVAQAAFQALIPDVVPDDERGISSGIKNALNVIGIAIGLIGTQVIVGAGGGNGPALAFLGVVLALAAATVYRWVPTSPANEHARRARSGLGAELRDLIRTSVAAFRDDRTFARAVLVQFTFLLGIYAVQRFLLYFLDERFGIENAATQAGGFLAAGILLGIVAAPAGGLLSDQIGHVPVLRGCIVLGSLGLAGVALAPNLPVTAVAGISLAVGTGGFLAVNWALISQGIPEGKGAQYFALANIATAGASAMAGLFGPLADVVGAIAPGDSYSIAFLIGALISLSSLWLLRGASPSGTDDPPKRSHPPTP